jgi:signal transduction histidine kinase
MDRFHGPIRGLRPTGWDFRQRHVSESCVSGPKKIRLHGKLALSRRPDARFVTLLVEDDGPGLTEEQAESMLLPGQRLDETVPGFGCGLARA